MLKRNSHKLNASLELITVRKVRVNRLSINLVQINVLYVTVTFRGELILYGRHPPHQNLQLF